MANRFPLILDTTDGNKIKEIPAGDNLDLRNVSIVDAQNIDALGTINAAAITINGEKLEPADFTDLADTPNNYTGFAGFLVRVKPDESGIEYVELGNEDVPLFTNTLTVSTAVLPSSTDTVNIGTSTNKFSEVHANFFQGSIKNNNGSTVFDATTGLIPYAVIAGRPEVVSDLPNDVRYVKADELRAIIPEFIEEGVVEVEVTNTGDLQGNVIADDDTILVDSANARINAARLTQNGAADGQTIVWDDLTQVWIPGTAGDITGFASNKINTLTVQSGYKIVYQDSVGNFEAETLNLTTTTRLNTGEVRITDSKDIYPELNNTGRLGRTTNKFNEVNATTINATSFVGDLNGDAIGPLHKADIGVFGDKSQGNAGYQLHVIGDLGINGGSLWMNGGSINDVNFEDATGNFRGSFYGDDSTVIVDGVNNQITGNLQFPDTVGTITGETIDINASDKINITDVVTSGEIIPAFNETGAIGTVARKFDQGNFVTLRADNFSIDTVAANTISTENFILSGTGSGLLQSATDLVISVGNRIRLTGGPIRLDNQTQPEVDNIVAQPGDIVYNTSSGRVEFFQNGMWVGLHSGLFEGEFTGSLYGVDSTPIYDGFENKIISPTVNGDAIFENNITVQGNLTVQGTTTSIETTNTEIKDNVITLNAGETGAGVSSGTSGIEVDRGTSGTKSLVWDEGNSRWTFGSEELEASSLTGDSTGNITQYNNITGTNVGNIQQFVNITGATGGTISQFTNITGDTGGTISQFTNITGDTGGTISGFTTLTGDSGGDITQFTNITGDTGGTISQFTNITGDTGGTISGFLNITGDTGGTISQFTNITGDGGGLVSGFDFLGDLTGDVTGNSTGYHTGDVTGSVFADDSSIIIDAVNRTVNSDNLVIDNGINFISSTADANLSIVSTSGIDIQGAASAPINIGIGTSGDVTVGTNNLDVFVYSDNATFEALTSTTIRSTNGNVLISAAGTQSISLTMDSTNGTTSLNSESSVQIESPSVVVSGSVEAAALKGTIVADDSTILVDAVAGKIVGDIINSSIISESVIAPNITQNYNINAYGGSAEAYTVDSFQFRINAGDLQMRLSPSAGTVSQASVSTIENISGTVTGNTTGLLTLDSLVWTNIAGVTTASEGDTITATIAAPQTAQLYRLTGLRSGTGFHIVSVETLVK